MGDYDWVPAAASAVGGMIGSAKQGQYADEAVDLQRKAYQQALDLINSGQLSYNPALANGVGPSAMEGVQADQQAVLAQRQALNDLGQASREGYNTVDKAAINGIMNQTGQQERSHREAALARLDPNSGAALAASLSAQQSGANQANQQGMDIAAASRMKALSALGQYGGLASNMRSQSFDEGAKRAQGMDAISRFNAETSQFNAGQRNAAMQGGIGNRLAAAGVLNGSSQNLAAGLNARGQLAFNQAAGGAGAVGNAVAAYGNRPKQKLDANGNPYDSDPAEWENPYGGY